MGCTCYDNTTLAVCDYSHHLQCRSTLQSMALRRAANLNASHTLSNSASYYMMDLSGNSQNNFCVGFKHR